MMTSLERVEAAFQLKEPDRVPVQLRLLGGRRRVTGVYYSDLVQNGELAAKCALETQELLEDDLLYAMLDMSVEPEGFGQKMIYMKDEVPYPDPNNLIIKSPDDYHKLERFDVKKANRCRELIKMADILANEKGSTHPITSLVAEPLVVLGHMRGMEALLKDCIKYPAAVKIGVEIVTDVIIDLSKALIDVGVKYLTLCHDYGNGSIMREDLFLEIEKEALGRWHKVIKETDTKLNIHNCGNPPYIDAAFSIGEFDCYQLCYLPKNCTSWIEFKEKYGKNVCILGPLNPTRSGLISPIELKADCKRYIEELGKGGGYILGPGCEFPANASMLNYKAVVDAAKEYGQYS